MLCWVLVEQTGHEHMSDEYKRPIYYDSVTEAPILGQPVKHETTAWFRPN